MLASHLGQDLKAFKSRYTRPEIASMVKDYLAGHDYFPWDELG